MVKRWMQWAGAVAFAGVMAACGGGGGGGDPLFGGGDDDGGGTPGPTVAAVDVISSLPEVQTGGTPVTISAIVKGAGNVSMPNTVVQFSTDTGTLSEAMTTTDAAGVATAKLSGGNDRSNRAATVTVVSGSSSGAVSVNIVGTKLSISGPTTLQLGETETLTAKLIDGAGSPVSNATLTATSALGNLASTTITTDAQGSASVSYVATNAGSDTVRFTGAGASALPLEVTVSGQDFAFVAPAPDVTIPVTTAQNVTVRYRVNGIPQAGVNVSFTATAGQLSATSAQTNAQGQATVSISANTASPATVQASFSSGGVSASATLRVEFVATVPNAVVVQITPTAVAPNAADSTTNQAQIIARVTDANGNPVKGRTVNFSRDLDPSGGNLSQPSTVTDSSGQATVQYVSGQTSTASNGVVIRATVASTGISGTASLTVSQAALFIALGTGNTILNLDEQTYQKDYTVYVTDANGVAVPNVTLTIRALPMRYAKGRLAFDEAWGATEVAEGAALVDAQGNIRPGQYITCLNEDLTFDDDDARSFNGVLDAGEDTNSNNVLEPGNVISVSPGTLRTDGSGRATLSLIYAESYAPWVEIALQVQAIVSGTASTTRSTFFVSGESEDFTDENVPPAGVDSPFGFKPTCSAQG